MPYSTSTQINVMVCTGMILHHDTMDTIIEEVGNLGGPERLQMMRNMMHLNQVSPLVMAGIDYFDKFQRKDEDQGTYYATEV